MKRIVGNIGALELPDGKWLFGRIMRDASVEFYKYAGDSENDLPKEYDVAFVVGVHKSVISQMKLVGKKPFPTEEDSWPPPKFIYDVIGKSYSLYIHGKIIPSSFDECKGLEVVCAMETRHIIDRFLGNNRWGPYVLDKDLSKV